jgi:hypothetical protein
LRTNPDVAAARINPLVHYRTSGWAERRDPHLLFSTAHYLSQLHTDAVNPLDHYLRTRGPLNPHPLFDSQFYSKQIQGLEMPGLVHYLHEGWRRGLDPHPEFDTSLYLERYPDVAAAGLNPLWHYVSSGRSEGRDPRPIP